MMNAMWWLRRRAAIESAAGTFGFGRVVRVHRQHTPVEAPTVVATAATIVGGIAAAIAALAGSRVWQWPLLLAAVLVGASILYVHVGPTTGSTGRRWYAVAERDLVIWSPRKPAVAIPFADLEGRRATTAEQTARRRDEPFMAELSWSDGARIRSVRLPDTCSARDLVAALQQRAPRQPWTQPRVLGLFSYAVTIAVVVAFG